MSIIRKVETAEVSDDLTFVLSDDTVDRYGDVIEAGGWDLRWFKRNPIALFGHDGDFPIGTWEDVRVEGGKLLGKLKLAAEGTSPRIDELRRLVQQKVLKAVSVGFKPVESEPLGQRGGVRYLKQELLETSLVSVPANPAALAVAKSLHVSPETMKMAFGEQADGRDQKVSKGNGEHAASLHLIPQVNKMTTLSERIQAAQDDLVREKDALTAHLSEEDADPIVTEELSGRIEAKQKNVDALKRAEQVLATKSVQSAVAPIPAAPQRKGVFAKEAKPADLIIRSAAVNLISFIANKAPEEIGEKMYPNDENTMTVVKAAVSPATTTANGWAAELVNTAMSDFLETLRPMSVYPALSAAGGGRLAFGPNQGAIKVPSRAPTPSIGGSFVGEGAPIPVRRLGLATVTLSPRKLGVISTFTREIARYSTPAIEGIIRSEILADTAITIDSVLLDDAAADGVRPAGLLNGVVATAATAGGGYAAILGDIRALRGKFDAVNAGSDLMLLVNPAQLEAFALTPGADGTLGWAADIVARYRIAASTAVPAGRVIMVRATDFVSATGDTPEFELSNDATLHMEDTAPAQIGAAGTPNAVAAPVRSMFQTATVAIRMLMDISWGFRRTGTVQYIDGATW